MRGRDGGEGGDGRGGGAGRWGGNVLSVSSARLSRICFVSRVSKICRGVCAL